MQKAADPKIKRLSLGVRMRADSGLSISAQWCQHLSIVRRVIGACIPVPPGERPIAALSRCGLAALHA